MPTNNISDLVESGVFALKPSAAQVVVTGATLVISETELVRLLPATAVTGLIMPAGQYDGQVITVENQAIFGRTATFDVAGTLAPGSSYPPHLHRPGLLELS